MNDNLYTVKSVNPAPKWLSGSLVWIILLAVLQLLGGSCSTNPATGELQLNLISEEQEIALGRQNDEQIVAMLGVYEDPELNEYVSNLGMELARLTERPDLPWTFRIVDDPTVNAFALPGGFIYVTRGILNYMGTEAELAAVLGHEIAHVTAKHAVERISSQALLQLGFGIGVAVIPELENFGGLIGAGLSLLYLSFSREDETQSDEIGLRYMVAAGYDPREMIDLMAMLDRVSRAGSGTRLPEWLSTHPDPGNRLESIRSEIEERNLPTAGLIINRNPYLARIDGTVFGPDPREGYFEDNVFYHPTLQFRFVFPENWQTTNNKMAVTGVSPQQDAIIQLSLTGSRTLEAAANEFFNQEGVRAGVTRRTTINGLPALWAEFSATVEGTELRGLSTFIAYDNNIYRLISYSTAGRWPGYERMAVNAFQSFAEVTDPEVLMVQPLRLDIVTINAPMTLAEYNQRFPSAISLESLALLNQMTADTLLESGQKLKRVVP